MCNDPFCDNSVSESGLLHVTTGILHFSGKYSLPALLPRKALPPLGHKCPHLVCFASLNSLVSFLSIQLHQLLTMGVKEVTYLCIQCRSTHFRGGTAKAPRELRQWLLGGSRMGRELDMSSSVFLFPAVGLITCTSFLC